MFSEQGLKDKIKFIANKKNVGFNTLMQMYVFERILKRISISSYKDKIVLKGGILLCSLYGLDNRVTQDIDLSMMNDDLKESTLKLLFLNVFNIDLNDGIQLTLINIEPINAQMEYEGYRAKIEYRFDKMHDIIYIDIATGDYITSSPTIYNYPQLLEENAFDILAYNTETIIAEKLETILKRGVANSRMKDYYDLYYISTHSYDIKINKELLISAISNTFKTREFSYNQNSFEMIKASNDLRNAWLRYSRNNLFAKNITFEDVLKEIEQYISLINNT